MANKGFALYRRDKDLYLLSVAYEYADTRFVGFDINGEVLKINKLNDKQKEWLKTHDSKQSEKTRDYIFLGDYYVYGAALQGFPSGKPYTQLPGGGGVYKETRKAQNIYELFKNETFLRALEKYGTFNEGRKILRQLIKEEVAKAVSAKKNSNFSGAFLKQEKLNVSFTAVSIEDESEKEKIKRVFEILRNEGAIPEDFIIPSFKDGTLDYHMTILMGELPLKFLPDLNQEVMLNINSIGVSDKAVALGVSGDYFSDGEKQHITLAFKDLPKDSKEIEKWAPLKNSFPVKGIIREFDVNKNILKRGVVGEANQNQIGNFPDQSVPVGNSRIFPKEEI